MSECDNSGKRETEEQDENGKLRLPASFDPAWRRASEPSPGSSVQEREKGVHDEKTNEPNKPHEESPLTTRSWPP
jgi:hypothetical protein